jgi:hypothetical protein
VAHVENRGNTTGEARRSVAKLRKFLRQLLDEPGYWDAEVVGVELSMPLLIVTMLRFHPGVVLGEVAGLVYLVAADFLFRLVRRRSVARREQGGPGSVLGSIGDGRARNA